MCESIKRPKDKREFEEILKKPSIDIALEDFSKEKAPLVNVDVEGVVFNTLLFPSDEKKLYVFLSAQGDMQNLGRYPIFQRVYWARYLKGVVLYLDDPTRIINNFSPCWYLGSPENNFHVNICKLIEKVAHVYGVQNEDIYLIGSSNTGFPSCACAAMLDGVKAIALNPQVDISTYLKHNRLVDIFMERMKFSLEDERLNISSKIDGFNKSKILLSFNRSSEIDEIQYQKLKTDMGFTDDINGIRKINNNLYVVTYFADSDIPHRAQPTASMVLYFIRILNKDSVTDEDINECEAFIDDITDLYVTKKKLFIADKKLAGIGRLDLKNIGGSSNRLDVVAKSDSSCKVLEPGWLCDEQGRGKVIESEAGKIELELLVTGDGLIKLWLRGCDIKDENGESLPLYVRFKTVLINNIDIIRGPVEVSCKVPFIYNLAARNGDILKVYAEWERV